MKIERWIRINKDTGVQEFYHTQETADYDARRYGGVVVLLTGELPEPKKRVRLAPALCKVAGKYSFSGCLYENEESARQNICKGHFICWPAPAPDKDGFVEVEVDG